MRQQLCTTYIAISMAILLVASGANYGHAGNSISTGTKYEQVSYERNMNQYQPVSYTRSKINFIEPKQTLMSFNAYYLRSVDDNPQIVEFILDNKMDMGDKIEYFFASNDSFFTIAFQSEASDIKRVNASAAKCPIIKLDEVSFIGFQKVLLDEKENHCGARTVTKISPEMLQTIQHAGCFAVDKIPTNIAKALDSGEPITTIYGLEHGEKTSRAQWTAEQYYKNSPSTSNVNLHTLLENVDFKKPKKKFGFNN